MNGANDILVTLPGGRRVDAQVGAHLVRTDQPREHGGEDTAPAPFQLFLASIGTCAGIFIQGFCAKRGVPFEGVRVLLKTHEGPDGALAGVDLDIEVPRDFPDKYLEALVKVADQCSVKKAIATQPKFTVRTRVAG